MPSQAESVNQTQVTTPALTIRPAAESDLETLGALLTALSDLSRYHRFQAPIPTPPRPALLRHLLHPTGAAWLATRADHPLAHAMWAWATPTSVPGASSPEKIAELAVVVADGEQGKGLGVRMLTVAAADAVEAGATHFLLVVGASNERSLGMVRRRWPGAVGERDGSLLSFVVPARPAAGPRSEVRPRELCRTTGR
ncbi:GNAT family N-acetyltransferase [Kribbella sandramycini]|uniref:GNAT family N-acetyltransferase n=1 Tax=Kribbella sandramycini TaxID=60450 RepID=A0A7Y4L5L9_9ACTN|nr:GNAT family N-acetyltransferase [Kribbella sandramycini]